MAELPIRLADRVMGLFGLQPKASKRLPRAAPWFGYEAQTYGWSAPAIKQDAPARASRFIGNPAMFGAINRIVESCAMADIQIYDGPGKQATPLPKHKFHKLLDEPNQGFDWLPLDRFTMLEAFFGSLLIFGESFLYLGPRESRDAKPLSLIPMQPRRLEPIVGDNKIAGWRVTIHGQHWDCPAHYFLWTKLWHPLEDLQGLSRVDPVNMSVMTDNASLKHNYYTFKNQARMSVILESDAQFVDMNQRKLMEQYWRDTMTGPERAGEVAFLWQGFKARDLGMNARDAEYVEGRKMNREDIMMGTGMHPALLLAEDVNLANAKVAEYLFARYTLSPLLKRTEGRFKVEIMQAYNDKHEMRFIDVVPRDIEQMRLRHDTYLTHGVMTINDVRKELGMDEVPWGNEPLTKPGEEQDTPDSEMIRDERDDKVSVEREPQRERTRLNGNSKIGMNVPQS